jgi:hypothetical protein
MRRVLTCLGMMSVLVLTLTVSSGFVSNGYHKAYARVDLDPLGTKIRESINNQITEELSGSAGPNPSSSSGSHPPLLTVTERTAVSTVIRGAEGSSVAFCNPGEQIIGGGFFGLPLPEQLSTTPQGTIPPAVYLVDNAKYFKSSPQGWQVTVFNALDHDVSIEARALCASLAP